MTGTATASNTRFVESFDTLAEATENADNYKALIAWQPLFYGWTPVIRRMVTATGTVHGIYLAKTL